MFDQFKTAGALSSKGSVGMPSGMGVLSRPTGDGEDEFPELKYSFEYNKFMRVTKIQNEQKLA